MTDTTHAASPTARDVTIDRFGVIDIGSNSVRFVIFDSAMRSPAYFFNEKVYCGLGTDIEKTGALPPDGKARALATLRRFALLIEALDVRDVVTVATAAMRDASDGPAFAEEIEAETGLRVRIISGREEGRFAALGVLMGDRRTEGIVADIGGASMELALVQAGAVRQCTTTPLGPLRLMETGKTDDDLNAHAARHVERNLPEDTRPGLSLTLVGGGWRAFATLVMKRNEYPLTVLHGYQFTVEQALETCNWLTGGDVPDLTDMGLSRTRADNAPWTAHVLRALIERTEPAIIGVSSCGLREGVLYESLTPAMRGDDPLTQTARVMERLGARFPGFGDELNAWITAILPEIPTRLRLAASLLADVNWRVHPDYRAGACFTTATQSSLVGLTHIERMMLAVALAYRYKDAKRAVEQQGGSGILTDDQHRVAEAMGRVIRLGAMLSGATPDLLRRCPLHRDETHLTLTIPGDLAGLGTDTVERRLTSAASALGVEARLVCGGK
jgi:exopolyphosphatase/guanosine-5'-triphosphate,3'-diphosphate pyrophosphatase